MGEGKTSFFVLDIILLVVFISLIFTVFNLSGIKFIAAVFGFIVILFLSFIALIGIYNGHNWGYAILSVIFAVLLIGLLLMLYLKRPVGSRFIWTTLLSALGFLISVGGIKRKEKEEVYEEPEEEVTTSYEPGKYVASKTGSTYHAPTCDWAKKIKEKNQVWFDDDKEAKKKYKAHSCLK